MKKYGYRVLDLPEKTVKSSSNLIVDGVPKNDVLLSWSHEDGKDGKWYSLERCGGWFQLKDDESQPKTTRVGYGGHASNVEVFSRSNNKAISQLQKVICIEGHLGV